jgi:hypothetical protein
MLLSIAHALQYPIPPLSPPLLTPSQCAHDIRSRSLTGASNPRVVALTWQKKVQRQTGGVPPLPYGSSLA